MSKEKEKKEEKSELIALAEEFKSKLENLYPNGNVEGKLGKRGILLIAVDNEASEEKIFTSAALVGNRSTLAIGTVELMKKSDKLRGVLQEIVAFYKFTDNPLVGLLSSLLDED